MIDPQTSCEDLEVRCGSDSTSGPLIALPEGAADGTARAIELIVQGSKEYAQGRLDTALTVLLEAKAVSRDLDGQPELVECLLILSRIYRDLGEFASATAQLDDALEVASRQNNTTAIAKALNLQAGILNAQGDYGQALECLQKALEIFRCLDSQEDVANTLSNTGTLRMSYGDYPMALEALKEAYEIYREVDPASRGMAGNLILLGRLYSAMGEGDKARQFFTSAMETADAAGIPAVSAAAMNNLADVHRQAGQWEEAGRLYEAALVLTRELRIRQYEVDNLDGLGQVHVALGRLDQAVATHTLALSIAQEIGDAEGVVDALLNLGRDYLRLNDWENARSALHSGLEKAEEISRARAVFEAHELLAGVYEATGDVAQALHHYRAFHETEKQVFNQENEEKTRRLTVQFELERAKHEAERYRLRTEVEQQAREEAEEIVRERTQDLEEAQLEIVTRLAVAAEYRDDDSGEHTRRVGRNAAAIAYALGWPEADVQTLFSAARLHDVGKIGISDTLLLKPGRFTPDEFELMRTHAAIGARILSHGHSRLLKMAEEIALTHHERWDGKGYPLGLAGESIPMSARIVAVADVLDALAHERPYKRAWSVDNALAEIKRQKGFHFDPQVVDTCLMIFESGELSPLSGAKDWNRTLRTLRKFAVTKSSSASTDQGSLQLKERYEKLLDERNRELRKVRREAQDVTRRMQELAFTDALTSLGNRRAFETDIEDEAARATRSGDALSVLTLDVDSLKELNDSEGHERGDALLRAAAHIMVTRFGEVGRFYRIGGDEFTAILPHLSAKDSERVRDQLEQAVRDLRDQGFSCASVSVGMAFLHEVSMPRDLLRLSDQRMYEEKLERRRQCIRARAEIGDDHRSRPGLMAGVSEGVDESVEACESAGDIVPALQCGAAHEFEVGEVGELEQLLGHP